MADIAVMAPIAMTLAEHGAWLRPKAAEVELPGIEAAISSLPSDHAGIRLHGVAGLHGLLAGSGSIGALAAEILGPACRPVRAILFDKSPATNWSLGWHQDRTIAVDGKRDVAGFGPWTVKAGMTHVAPPFDVIASMLTLRIHLDAVPASNAPLLIVPGSHRLGRIAERDIAGVVANHGIATCLAERGDVWIYSTPILHASAAATGSAHRRVLQVDFAANDLPGGLLWLGI
jgi:hypothetical protein